MSFTCTHLNPASASPSSVVPDCSSSHKLLTQCYHSSMVQHYCTCPAATGRSLLAQAAGHGQDAVHSSLKVNHASPQHITALNTFMFGVACCRLDGLIMYFFQEPGCSSVLQ